MRQISRLSVIAVSIALLMALSSCSDTQNTPETDDQPSTPTENRETVTSGQISDVPENNNAGGESPQGSVTYGTAWRGHDYFSLISSLLGIAIADASWYCVLLTGGDNK